jgi:hypothetical protein
MAKRKRGYELTQEIKSTHKRIEHWRKTREKRTAMPEKLWKEAARLAHKHGIYPIARQLHLSYDSLKYHTSKSSNQKPSKNQASTSEFVELSPIHLVSSSQCPSAVVQLEHSDGSKLLIQMSKGSDLDIQALTDSYWNRKR